MIDENINFQSNQLSRKIENKSSHEFNDRSSSNFSNNKNNDSRSPNLSNRHICPSKEDEYYN